MFQRSTMYPITIRVIFLKVHLCTIHLCLLCHLVFPELHQGIYTQNVLYTSAEMGQGFGVQKQQCCARICKTVNLLRSPGVDSQPDGPVRQPYLSYRPAMLHRQVEIESSELIPCLLKRLHIWALYCATYSESGRKFIISMYLL